MTDRGALGGFTRNGDSYAETDEPPEYENPQEAVWFYIAGGEKNGPVSARVIKDLLEDGTILPEVNVWRRGMKNWTPLRNSDLEYIVSSEPPAISPGLIGNGYVWMMACLPLLYSTFDAMMAQSNSAVSFPWQFHGPIIGLFGLMDFFKLRKAGYENKWMAIWAVTIAPVYLFLRASRLKQKPTYAIASLASLAVYALVEGGY